MNTTQRMRLSKKAKTKTVYGYHRSQSGSNNPVYFYNSDRKKKTRLSHIDDNGQRIYVLEDGTPFGGFAVEFELETSRIRGQQAVATVLHDIILRDFPEEFWRYESDCSLGSGAINGENVLAGVECVSQVMSKACVRNFYPRFKLAFQYMETFGFSASATGHCGMHVNVSNRMLSPHEDVQMDCLRKLYWLFNKSDADYKFWCYMLQRKPSQTRYCSRMHCGTKEETKRLDIRCQPNSHGVCLNYGHVDDGRFEIRLVGGQPTYNSFRNTMEVVIFLVDKLKSLSWDKLDDLDYVFRGCNKYVVSRLKLAAENGALGRETLNKIIETSDDKDNFDALSADEIATIHADREARRAEREAV